MRQHYSHLSLRERMEMDRLHCAGESLRSIAKQLGRSGSTVSRELRRNSIETKVWSGGYDPVRAESLAQRRRRWDCRFKLERQPALRCRVRNQLELGWSPEQIAGRLRREYGRRAHRRELQRSTTQHDFSLV